MIREPLKHVDECCTIYGMTVLEILTHIGGEYIGMIASDDTKYRIIDRMQYALHINRIRGLYPIVEFRDDELYIDYGVSDGSEC